MKDFFMHRKKERKKSFLDRGGGELKEGRFLDLIYIKKNPPLFFIILDILVLEKKEKLHHFY